MIAPTAIIAGIGKSLSMDIIRVPGATGDYSSNIMEKGKAALELLTLSSASANEFGLIHVKAVDDAGHDKDFHRKKHFIEKVDEMIGVLVAGCLGASDLETILCITGDHSTPVELGDHSFEPVPFVAAKIVGGSFSGISVDVDAVTRFDESIAALGCFGRFSGDKLLPILFSLINK